MPSYEVKSTYNFNVTATDTNNVSSTRGITLNVLDLAPTFVSGTSTSITEGLAAGTVVYAAQASEPGGGSLTYSLSGPDASAFSVNSTGVVTINSVPSYETKSSYSITVNAVEASSLSTPQSVTITVLDLAPTFFSGTSVSVNEGISTIAAAYIAQASEPGGGTLTYSLLGTDAASFNINSVTGVMTFKSVPSYETKSSYNVTVRATEASSVSSSQAVTINILDVAPVFSSGNSGSLNEGASAGTFVYQAQASEPGGGSLTYSLSGTDASAFSINASTGVVTINSVPNYETKSSYSITVNAVEASSLSNPQPVTIIVIYLAQMFLSGTSASINEGVSTSTTVYTAHAVEPGGGSLIYSISGTDAASFNINSVTGVMTFKSVPSYETKSSYNVTVRATEASSVSSTQPLTINITDVAPVFVSGNSASVTEGVSAGTVVYTAQAREPGGGTVTYSLSGADASAFSINSATGVLTINAVPNYETKSSYNVTVTATESSFLSNAKAVTINVMDVAPVFLSGNSGSVTDVASTGTVVYTAQAVEPGGGSLTYSISGVDAASFSINSSTGAVTINSVPHYNIKSTYNFNVTATDASALSGSEPETLTVNQVMGQSPSLTAPSYSVSGTFSFSFTNVAGASFAALASTNLALPLSNWTVLGPITDSPPGHYQFNDSQATNGLRFYTVRSP